MNSFYALLHPYYEYALLHPYYSRPPAQTGTAERMRPKLMHRWDGKCVCMRARVRAYVCVLKRARACARARRGGKCEARYASTAFLTRTSSPIALLSISLSVFIVTSSHAICSWQEVR